MKFTSTSKINDPLGFYRRKRHILVMSASPYRVPALEKGLDLLEAVASSPEPLTVLEGGELVIIHRNESPRPVRLAIEVVGAFSSHQHGFQEVASVRDGQNAAGSDSQG